ncbi:hypothetical protein C0J52_21879 [Blattella germanica]|nr:hypothetical protein C0J52_21879 [Blattella germanica]
MQINIGKTTSVAFTKKREYVDLTYHIGRKVIPQVKHCKYLGVYLSESLGWDTEVNNTTCKAWKTVHFVMWFLKKGNAKSKEIAYKSLVRSTVEYGTSCWDPYKINQIDSLQRVQKRAAKFVRRGEGHGIERVAKKARLGLLFKTYKGHKAWRDILARIEKPTYYSRGDHKFKINTRKQRT